MEGMKRGYYDLLEEARKAEEAGDYGTAIEKCKRVVQRLASLRAETRHKWGNRQELFINSLLRGHRISRVAGRYEDAAWFIDTLEEAEPDYRLLVLYMRTSLMIATGRYKEGKELVRTINSEVEDFTPTIARDLAALALDMDDPALALEVLDRMQFDEHQIFEDSSKGEQLRRETGRAWALRIIALLASSRIEEALAESARLRRLQEDLVPHEHILAHLLERGDAAGALDYAEGLPNANQRGLWRGMALAALGKEEAARDEWWRVARQPADDLSDNELEDWAHCALRTQEWERLEPLFEKPPLGKWEPAFYHSLRSVYQAKKGLIEDALVEQETFKDAIRDWRFHALWLMTRLHSLLIEQAIPDPALRSQLLEAAPRQPVSSPADEERAG